MSPGGQFLVSLDMLFKLTDGRTLHFSLGEEQLDESHYTVQIFKRVSETT